MSLSLDSQTKILGMGFRIFRVDDNPIDGKYCIHTEDRPGRWKVFEKFDSEAALKRRVALLRTSSSYNIIDD